MGRKWVWIVGLAGVAAVLRAGGPRRPRRDWPVNFAHRGASAVAPENTLEAFRLAVEAGAGGLELDLHMTGDGGIVVIHDPTVERTTDGQGAVAGMTLSEIQQLDAGYHFSSDEGISYPYRGVRVPTFAEVYREFPRTFVNAEIKEPQPGVEEAVLRVVREAGAEGRTLIVSTRDAVVKRFRRLAGGDISTGASRREILGFYLLSRLHMERLCRPGYDALQVPLEYRGIPLVTPRFLAAAHNRGLRVDVWTINDAEEMRALLDLGVDVVMTDRPGELAAVLAQHQTSATRSADATPRAE